jgi:hypothetical protein
MAASVPAFAAVLADQLFISILPPAETDGPLLRPQPSFSLFPWDLLKT